MRVARTALAVGATVALCLTSNNGICQQLSVIRANQLSHIVGMTVENRDGEKLGKVKDLIVNKRTGEAKYGIIGTGGFLGVGSQVKLVPAVALSLATTKKGIIALDVSKTRWVNAPIFRKKELAQLGEPNQFRTISGFYGLKPSGADVRASDPAHSKPALELAARVVGERVVNRQKERLGIIADLLVDLQGQKPTFAILSTGPLLKRQGFAVAFRELKPIDESQSIFAAAHQSFDEAPLFDEKAWEAASQAGRSVYRFPEKEADNTRRNRRDQHTSALTPLQQSESDADRQFTSLVRRSIVNDETLSLTAKNIKIITVNGTVTLRGPVRREEEKGQIVRHAARIAGMANVVNELEAENK